MASSSARSAQLEEDDLLYSKGNSNVTAHSEDTTTTHSEDTTTNCYTKSHDSQDTVRSLRPISTFSNSSMRVCRLSSLTDDNTRFPKLQDCAHFHYDTVDIHSLKVCIFDDDEDVYHHSESIRYFYIKITSNNKTWIARRTLNNFRMLDQKLHRCIFDRKFSHLPDLVLLDVEVTTYFNVHAILGDYLNRFSTLAGSMLNCGSVLNWLEIDNRGNRLLTVDDSGINTPAIAAAHVVKRYLAQASDEISLEVGDIVSVIDMPPTEDTIWWRGKRGFEVGFFPYECVEVIGGKIPQSVVSSIPETPQNNALLKKHGKFLSLLRMFFNTRPERIQLKQSGIVKERVFGCDLGEHLLNSGHDVPLVLKSCSAVIEKEGLVDGIYRLSGITSNIQKLRLAFDEDRVPNLTSEEYLQDVHSISSLLKMYFRELPNPLLTYQLYDKFANAVKDEDNKLLRIHDVVQQLPPPHYRTTKYLMRHLAQVASRGHETGMHSKNLAIVWAPNLLRSKELESGGGAAALQGVGIQAVVTEFLILYADVIFSDKMPSYSSPDLKKTHKKPRPKSLAISTPTRLLTLEEARERALAGGFAKPEKKYIDLDVEPSDLSSKYHTVLNLPGYKKKGSKEALAKGKKSPSRGLKSLFSKNRSASVRQKGLKSLHNSSNFDLTEQKAITEEDVQHWKRRRIRSAKSAESLLSLPAGCHLGSSLSASLDPDRLMNVLAGKENSSPAIFSLSQSIESRTQLLSNTQGYSSLSFPSFVLEDEGSREVAVDVNPSDVNLDCSGGFSDTMVRGQSESASEMRQRQSFVRNESKRRVICHRRTPSAPITNRNNHQEVDHFTENDNLLHRRLYEKSQSIYQSVQDMELDSKPPKCSGKLVRHDSESEKFYIHSVMLESPCNLYVNFDDGGAEKRKGSKTPPKDRKKLKEGKEKCLLLERGVTPINERSRHSSKKENIPCDSRLKQSEIIEELPESPGSKCKHWCNATSKSEECSSSSISGESVFNHYISSRVHDYAEIDEKELDDNLEPYIDEKAKSVFRKSLLASRVYHVESIDGKQSHINKEVDVLVTDFPINSVKYNHLDTNCVEEDNKSSDLLIKIVDHEQIVQPTGYNSSNELMSEWTSLPSDVQKSLKNIGTSCGSNLDILSSVTISEQGKVFQGHTVYGLDIQRRSTSLDGLTDESPLSQTVHEFNAKIDKGFRHDKHKAQSLREIQSSQEIDHNSCVKELISCEDEDEVCLTPTGQWSFDSMKDVNMRHPDSAMIDKHERSDPEISGNGFKYENKFADQPVVELHIASVPRVIRAPLRASKSVNNFVNVATSPTRPSPPASLDIPTSVATSQSLITQLGQCPLMKGLARPCDEGSTTSVPSKTGFSISEEDFQKLLMSDPDSMCQLEQIMLYSPVRFRNKGFSDEKCNRSSVASPLESVMTRSNYGSPEASPASSRGHHINRSGISPDASPIPTRLLSNSACNTIENSPKFQQMLNQSFNSKDSSPNSKLIHTQSVSSCESSPQSRQKHNQSFSCTEASPPSRQKLKQSMSSTEGSPPTTWIIDESFSSADSDPIQHYEQCLNNPKASPQLEKCLNYSTTSAHFGKTQSTRSSRKQADGLQMQHEKKCFGVQLPELEKSKGGRLVSSPVSPPKHTQPRWDDLACLNESFKEIDMSVFNENWKNCLAPTGNAIRLSANVSGSSEHLVSQSEPEIGIDTNTMVLERPSIRHKLREPSTYIGNTFQKSTHKNRDTDDNIVSEQKSLLLQQHEATMLENRPIATDQPTSRHSCTFPSTRKSSNQSALSTPSRQSSQSSIQIRSESSQSSVFNCPDVDQSNGPGEISHHVSVHTLSPQILEEMDVSESCLGITSHQNISNEMKEMLQEQLRELTAVPLPLDVIMTPFSSIGSPRSQTQSFFDANPLGCFDMETSFEMPSDIGQLNLPEIHIQVLCDGPTVTASPNILSQLHCTPVHHILQPIDDHTVSPVHQPIDNTEETFQNALNDNLEWNLASSKEHLLHHTNVCEPLEKFSNEANVSSCGGSKHYVGYVDAGNVAETSASTFTVKDTPPPVMLNSLSSSTSSLVDLMSTSYTHPQNFDVGHNYSTMVNSLSSHGDLAPPPLEMIEICKAAFVLAKPPLQSELNLEILPEQNWKHSPQEAINATRNILRTPLYGNLLPLMGNRILERGEEKLVMELRPSLKKKPKQECESKPTAIHSSIVNDTDHVDSGLEDDVFVDPSDVTHETHFFAAGSKYFKCRDFLSSDHAPRSNRDGSEKGRVFSFDVSSSFSDVDLPGSENQSVNEGVIVTADYHERFMGVRHDIAEDIRLNKAYQSSKLLNRCEKFEKVTGQVSLSPETDENIIQQTITSPEKNSVSSLRQMHDSFDLDKRNGEIGELFGKPHIIRKVSSEEHWPTNKDTKLCQSPTDVSNKDMCATFDNELNGIKKHTGLAKIPAPSGKPPLHNGKIRTQSESSISETKSSKTPAKSSKAGVSPIKPKGQSQLCAATEVNFKTFHGKEFSQDVVKQGWSLAVERQESSSKIPLVSSSKIPVFKQSNSSPTRERQKNSSKIPVLKHSNFSEVESKLDSMPINLRQSWGSGSESVLSDTYKDDANRRLAVGRLSSGELTSKSQYVSNDAAAVNCDKSDRKKRRGSIKKLTNIFEEKIENVSKGASGQPASQVKLISRAHSTTPVSVTKQVD